MVSEGPYHTYHSVILSSQLIFSLSFHFAPGLAMQEMDPLPIAEHLPPAGGPWGGVGTSSPGRTWRGLRRKLQEPHILKLRCRLLKGGQRFTGLRSQAGRALPGHGEAPRLGTKVHGTLLLSSPLLSSQLADGKTSGDQMDG